MYRRKPQGWLKHLDFILLDLFCLHVAFTLAYITRHGLFLPYCDRFYFGMAVVYTLTDVIVLIVYRTLQDVVRRGYYREFAKTFKHVIIVQAVVALYLFSMQDGIEYSRIVFYLMWVYYLGLTYCLRLAYKKVLRTRIKPDRLRNAIYFLTTTDRAENVISRFCKYDTVGKYSLQGLCFLDENNAIEQVLDVPVVCRREEFVNYLCDKWADEVYVSVPAELSYPVQLIDSLVEMGIVVHIQVENLHNNAWQQQAIEYMGGATVRTIGLTMATPRQAMFKRAIDIAGGIVGCVLTGVLTLFLAPMIWIKSPGPIFFKQTRVGQNGKLFEMYKFRSMYPDAEARKAELMEQNRVSDGMMFKLEYDPRIIGCKKLPDGTVKKGIGNFIRDYSIDEFPQFWNVVKGDLSLVGTRPPTVDEWEKYELHHRARLAIKPGITGLWQVSGRSNITDFEQVVQLDKEYIQNWSMGLDFRILLQTVKVVLGKEGSM
ncbi:MAG: sugar transferase [Clostridia bacterium]|nr:sugar transferase [Clostridia bacterium]